MAGAHGVLLLTAEDVHRAIEAGAAVPAPENTVTQRLLVLVLPAATHGVLVYHARRKLHLVHFIPAFGAAEALSEEVLNGSIGAVFTLLAVCVPPWGWAVIVQVGPFMALRTANGAILRVSVFSLGTRAVSLLPVPGVRDQSTDPRGEYFHQQCQEHQWQQRARHGGEAHVRPAVASHSPIRAQAAEAAAVGAGKVAAKSPGVPGMGGSGGPKRSRGLR